MGIFRHSYTRLYFSIDKLNSVCLALEGHVKELGRSSATLSENANGHRHHIVNVNDITQL